MTYLWRESFNFGVPLRNCPNSSNRTFRERRRKTKKNKQKSPQTQLTTKRRVKEREKGIVIGSFEESSSTAKKEGIFAFFAVIRIVFVVKVDNEFFWFEPKFLIEEHGWIVG
jgi:hypothetical protein